MQQRRGSIDRLCIRDGVIRKFSYREVEWEGQWYLAIDRGCDSQDASQSCANCIRSFDAEYAQSHQCQR